MDEADFDEQYEGDYSIERRILFTGVPKYDRPHLNVTKTLDEIVDETLPWGYNETHLAGETKTRKVATYTITIENDGNSALGPIYVRDLFPPGSSFIEPSSVRPVELTDTYGNWTLTHLSIGDVSLITLKLDVTKYYPDELTNRVEVWGGYNGEWVCASNFSALEMDWLSCGLNDTIAVKKTAEVDETNSSIVQYRVEVVNNNDVTMVATATDSLPEGMVVVDSSVPFASYEDGIIVWNLVEIGPFETTVIEYAAQALWSGRFENSVEVDARSVDGSVVRPVGASNVIEVGEVEEGGATSCNGWEPPEWGFVSVCDEGCELEG